MGIVFPAPDRESISNIVEGPEPVRVQALVAQLPMKTFHMPVLHRVPRLDVHQADLAVLGPAQHLRGELRAVVQTQVLRPSTLFDHSLQHPRHPCRAQAGAGFQRQALARTRIDHVLAPAGVGDRTSLRRNMPASRAAARMLALRRISANCSGALLSISRRNARSSIMVRPRLGWERKRTEHPPGCQ